MAFDQDTICIFVSSTFRDMDFERDVLKERVLPRLRNSFSSENLRIDFIDLRWGLDTSEADEEKENVVLKTCFEEIKRCQPYFILLLGGRYGYIPARSCVSAYFGNKEQYFGKSVTALEAEIAFSELSLRDDSLHVFSRKIENESAMPVEVRSIYSDAFAGREESAQKLEEFRSELADKGIVRPYSAFYDKETHQLNLDEFEAVVFKQIEITIQNRLDRREKNHYEMLADKLGEPVDFETKRYISLMKSDHPSKDDAFWRSETWLRFYDDYQNKTDERNQAIEDWLELQKRQENFILTQHIPEENVGDSEFLTQLEKDLYDFSDPGHITAYTTGHGGGKSYQYACIVNALRDKGDLTVLRYSHDVEKRSDSENYMLWAHTITLTALNPNPPIRYSMIDIAPYDPETDYLTEFIVAMNSQLEQEKNVICVIDGIERLYDDPSHGMKLQSNLNHLGEKVYVHHVLTCGDSPLRQNLIILGASIYNGEQQNAKQVIETMLLSMHKQLSPTAINKILTSPISKNPTAIALLLSELGMIDNHDFAEGVKKFPGDEEWVDKMVLERLDRDLSCYDETTNDMDSFFRGISALLIENLRSQLGEKADLFNLLLSLSLNGLDGRRLNDGIEQLSGKRMSDVDFALIRHGLQEVYGGNDDLYVFRHEFLRKDFSGDLPDMKQKAYAFLHESSRTDQERIYTSLCDHKTSRAVSELSETQSAVDGASALYAYYLGKNQEDESFEPLFSPETVPTEISHFCDIYLTLSEKLGKSRHLPDAARKILVSDISTLIEKCKEDSELKVCLSQALFNLCIDSDLIRNLPAALQKICKETHGAVNRAQLRQMIIASYLQNNREWDGAVVLKTAENELKQAYNDLFSASNAANAYPDKALTSKYENAMLELFMMREYCGTNNLLTRNEGMQLVERCLGKRLSFHTCLWSWNADYKYANYGARILLATGGSGNTLNALSEYSNQISFQAANRLNSLINVYPRWKIRKLLTHCYNQCYEDAKYLIAFIISLNLSKNYSLALRLSYRLMALKGIPVALIFRLAVLTYNFAPNYLSAEPRSCIPYLQEMLSILMNHTISEEPRVPPLLLFGGALMKAMNLSNDHEAMPSIENLEKILQTHLKQKEDSIFLNLEYVCQFLDHLAETENRLGKTVKAAADYQTALKFAESERDRIKEKEIPDDLMEKGAYYVRLGVFNNMIDKFQRLLTGSSQFPD